MKKLWRVAVYEYKRNVFKKGFFLMLLSVPFLVAFSVGFGLFIESRGQNTRPVGYFDQAGIIKQAGLSTELKAKMSETYSHTIEFIAYTSREAANAALESMKIQAYFILPEHYRLSRRIEVVYLEKPGQDVWRQFYDLLKINLLATQSPDIAYRATTGVEVIVRSIDGKRQAPSGSGPTFGLLMPFFIAMAFLILLLIGSGYTLSAVADEKENRTMEVLLTTLSPNQLIGGKILGILMINLTLLAAWAVITWIGITISRMAGVGWFNDLRMDWSTIFAVIIIGIPAYALATALMTAIGVMVTTTQEGQSVSTLFFILHILPFYISWSFLSNPHNILANWLSMLPFTSMVTVALRNMFTIVPAWQIAVSATVQVFCAGVAIWLASRAFQLGILRYGQRLSWRGFIRRN